MISEIANSLFLTYLASEYIISTSSSSSSSSVCNNKRSRTHTLTVANHYEQDNDDDNAKATAKKLAGATYRYNSSVIGALLCLVILANILDQQYFQIPSLVENFNIPSLVELVEDNNNNTKSTLFTTYAYIWSPILKVGGAATSYVVTLYIDVHRQRLRPPITTPTGKGREARRATTERRRRKRIPFRSVYLPQVGWAFLRILPAYPFLAVLISFLFLFVIDIWDYVFHLPVEYWNKPIYYGTLYGPFAYTYVYVKKQIVNTFRHDDKKERHDHDHYHYDDGAAFSSSNRKEDATTTTRRSTSTTTTGSTTTTTTSMTNYLDP